MLLRRVVAAVLALALAVSPAVASATSQSDDDPVVDQELIDALDSIDVLNDWLAASGMSNGVTALAVTNDETYATTRQVILAMIDDMHKSGLADADRGAEIELLGQEIAELDVLVVKLRRSLVTTSAGAKDGLESTKYRPIPVGADHDDGPKSTRGIVAELVADRLIELRQYVLADIGQVVPDLGRGTKTYGLSTLDLGAVRSELVELDVLLEVARGESLRAQLAIAARRTEVVDLFPSMHERRPLNTSPIDGLPFVTIDAYVSAAEINASTCAVDWRVLAGIGRIESRHGTIGGSAVRSDGSLTRSIFGPLLDGGETERRRLNAIAAADAAAQAILDAEDAEELRIEEEEDLAVLALFGPSPTDPIIVDDPERDMSADLIEIDPLYGVPVNRPEEPAADEAPEVLEDNADDDDSDEEEEVKGNGFAVILDSDRGALDGNSEWDRAIGPMQFIPETWARFKMDGNGDGRIDSQNLYDSAASAARLLCHLRARLGPSPHVYLRGYNDSERYVDAVLGVADDLAEYELPTLPSAG